MATSTSPRVESGIWIPWRYWAGTIDRDGGFCAALLLNSSTKQLVSSIGVIAAELSSRETQRINREYGRDTPHNSSYSQYHYHHHFPAFPIALAHLQLIQTILVELRHWIWGFIGGPHLTPRRSCFFAPRFHPSASDLYHDCSGFMGAPRSKRPPAIDFLELCPFTLACRQTPR